VGPRLLCNFCHSRRRGRLTLFLCSDQGARISGHVSSIADTLPCLTVAIAWNTEASLYEQELADLQARPFLTSEQQWRVSELKKLKLIAKDHMEALIRVTRSR